MTAAVESSANTEDRAAYRNAIVYACLQATSGAAAPINIALGGLVGSYLLAADKSLATAPITGFNLGVALAAIPAAMLMRMLGRKAGFTLGALIGVLGMAVATGAVLLHSFPLFCLALAMTGTANGFAQQYRFAAADFGSAQFRVKAISFVLVGGVVASVIGPQVVLQTRDLLAPTPFAGAFLAGAGLFAIAIVIASFLAPAPVAAANGQDTFAPSAPARPLREIMMQPRFIVAVLCGTGAYALMSLVMTAAPLAMVYCGFSVDEATLGIQWHVLAMFAPSFFTGHLIARFGKDAVVALGMLILIACAIVALQGIELAHFWGALVLLGIGWNFGFVGATAMVTETYRPSEKSKAQGANDFILFGAVAFSSLMSGRTMNAYGWSAVNMVVFPVAALCLVALAASFAWNRKGASGTSN